MVKIQSKYLNPLCSALGIFYFKSFTLLFLLLLSLSSHSQAIAEIDDAKNNFGYVKRGELVSCVYEITNSGKEPLLLQDAEISCSCTSVEFSKEPVMPGKKTKVTVLFNTKTVYGRQDRVVLIHSNASNSPSKLRYKGIVSNK